MSIFNVKMSESKCHVIMIIITTTTMIQKRSKNDPKMIQNSIMMAQQQIIRCLWIHLLLKYFGSIEIISRRGNHKCIFFYFDLLSWNQSCMIWALISYGLSQKIQHLSWTNLSWTNFSWTNFSWTNFHQLMAKVIMSRKWVRRTKHVLLLF